MRFIRAGALARLAAIAAPLLFFSVVSLALPHPAFAVIHLGEPNTVSLSNGLVGYWPLDGSVTNWTSSPRSIFRAAATRLNDNKWHLLTGVYSASKTQIYLDGVLRDSEPSGTFTPNLGPLQIGSAKAGIIDDVRIYDRALTAGEVQQLYLAGK